jgi:hypothetical protein
MAQQIESAKREPEVALIPSAVVSRRKRAVPCYLLNRGIFRFTLFREPDKSALREFNQVHPRCKFICGLPPQHAQRPGLCHGLRPHFALRGPPGQWDILRKGRERGRF